MSAVIHYLDRPFQPPRYREPTSEQICEGKRTGFEFSKPIPDVSHWKGHRLPLRLEFNISEPVVYYELVDADHRRVDMPGDFDQLREIMFAANKSAVKYYRNKGQVLRGDQLCFFERLSDLHPCDRHSPRLGLAFECLIFRVHTDWITDVDLWQLRNGVGVLEDDMTPKRMYVRRWHDWRLRENDLLRRRKLA